MSDYKYIIVGGGMTAESAARGIREMDGEGTIAMIAAERHEPYSRPPLTKALWKGEPEASIWRDVASSNVTLKLGSTVVALDPSRLTVLDDSGAEYSYEKLLLATGGTPRTIGTPSDRIIYFRTLDDYRRLRELASHRGHIVVVGGGFIGAEVAAALSMNDVKVTMIVPEGGLSARVFPSDLAAFLVNYYRERGVTMRMQDGVRSITENAGAVTVATSSGESITADAAVPGLGILPNVELGRQAGLTLDNGIVVNSGLHTSDPNIFAAGDVANIHNPQLDRWLRAEHEDNANTMGTAAGRAMAGEPLSYDHIPFFYSDLFDLGYEAVGDVDARYETMADWKDRFREGVVYYMKDGRVRGVLLWNVWNQVDAARALLSEPGVVELSSLAGRLPE